MEEEELCSVCFNRSMTMQNGQLICAVCGTQSQAFVEEAMDDWEGQQGKRRAVRFRTEEKAKAVEGTLSVEALMKAYCKALQSTLQVSRLPLVLPRRRDTPCRKQPSSSKLSSRILSIFMQWSLSNCRCCVHICSTSVQLT